VTWVRRQPTTEVHQCAWPMFEVVYKSPSMFASDDRVMEHRYQTPEGRVGDLWRCPDCRALWLIAMGCPSCTWGGRHGAHHPGWILHPVWMRARWWQRLIYRK
jgi:hypothetical protein